LPELYELKNVFENNQWHHETTFEHILLVLREFENIASDHRIDFLNEKIDNHTKFDLLKIAILLHDISKNDTLQIAEDKTTSFPSHEEYGAKKSKVILNRFELTENEARFIIAVIGNHGAPHNILGYRENSDQKLDELKNQIPEIYRETMLVAVADTMGSKMKQNNPNEFDFRIGKYKKILEII